MAVTQPAADAAVRGPRHDVARAYRDTAGPAFAVASIIGLGAVLVIVRSTVDPAVVALVLACGVAIAGQIGGRWTGLAAAAAAALSFNFFHTRPYLSLRIHSSDDVLTTFTLLAVGLVAGMGSDIRFRWQRRADRAIDELAAVERVAEVLSGNRDDAALIGAATTGITALLGLESCEFVPGAAVPAAMATLSTRGALLGIPSHVYRAEGFELPAGGFAIAVHRRGHVVGHLRCVPGPGVGVSIDRRRAAVTVAGLLGAGLAAP